MKAIGLALIRTIRDSMDAVHEYYLLQGVILIHARELGLWAKLLIDVSWEVPFVEALFMISVFHPKVTTCDMDIGDAMR